MGTCLPKNSGIYCLYFKDDPNKYYIGCSIDVYTRAKKHLNALNAGGHHNYKIQAAYNTYGTPEIELLELCDVAVLYEVETRYIQEFDSFESGYNLTLGGDGRLFGENSGTAKHNLNEYVKVLELLATTNLPYSKISSLTRVSRDIVKHIAGLRSHQYLQEAYPNYYAKIVEKYKNRDNSALSKGIKYPNLISPSGEIYTVENIHKFANDNNLQYQNLHKVLTGIRKSHKGWKIDVS